MHRIRTREEGDTTYLCDRWPSRCSSADSPAFRALSDAGVEEGAADCAAPLARRTAVVPLLAADCDDCGGGAGGGGGCCGDVTEAEVSLSDALILVDAANCWRSDRIPTFSCILGC